MRIRLFALFRDIAGTREINESGSSVRELLDNLVIRYGDRLRHKVYTPEGKISDIVMILIDGKNIDVLNGLETPLLGNETVSIFPPVSGG